MLEAGIKTLEEVKKDVLKDSHVDLTTNTNTVTDAKEMMNKLLEGGTAFKGKMMIVMMVAMVMMIAMMIAMMIMMLMMMMMMM